MRRVRGTCPACGCTELALTRSGGMLTCCHEHCPRPTAAAEILADADVDHVVQLGRDDFTLRHPLRERLDDQLLECDLHADLAALPHPPKPPGRYRLTADPLGGWVFTPLDGAGR